MIPIKSGVSLDLPEYLAGKYSRSNLSPNPVRPSKTFLPELKLGVSEESPEFFKCDYVNVLDNELKATIIARRDSGPKKFLSTLKKYKLNEKRNFQPQEFSISKKLTEFDLHSLPLDQSLDCIYTESRQVRNKSDFFKK